MTNSGFKVPVHFQYKGSIYTACGVRCTGQGREMQTTDNREKVTCQWCKIKLDRLGST